MCMSVLRKSPLIFHDFFSCRTEGHVTRQDEINAQLMGREERGLQGFAVVQQTNFSFPH